MHLPLILSSGAGAAASAAAQWLGPFGKIYSDTDCPNAGNHPSSSVEECEALCNGGSVCNAFNYGSGGCALRACAADKLGRPSIDDGVGTSYRLSGWRGPFDKIYSDADCPNVGNHPDLSVTQCEALCAGGGVCNAFNYGGGAAGGCALRACAEGRLPSVSYVGDVSYRLAAAAAAWRVMPLGDSITLGVGGEGGYRCDLAALLGDAGVTSALVGPMQDQCGGHGGYNGQTLQQIAEHVESGVVTAAAPDAVALMAGTNDFYFYRNGPDGLGANATVAVGRLLRLLDGIFAARPSAVVGLSTVTHINVTLCKDYPSAPWHPAACPADMPANIDAFNAQLPGIAAAQRKRQRKVYLHDINAAAQWVAADYSTWGIHFSPVGYQKMAHAWLDALLPYAPHNATPRST